MTNGTKDSQQLLRQLPSVDKLLQRSDTQDLLATYGRDMTLHALRSVLDRSRDSILAGDVPQTPGEQELVDDTGALLNNLFSPTLYPVINATGIIVHTNLGRAPLSRDAMAAMQSVAKGYSTLEYDSVSGKRGSRSLHAETMLTHLTSAERALVVNNNAAAVLLMLTALCRGREVIISRGQLIEIGGGFRVPDVMIQSGAQLVEVGTTNRTHLYDYEKGINDQTAAILVAHPSNYRVIGFTSEPSLSELAELAHTHGIPLLYDQGSGALLDVTPYGLDPEPTVLDGLAAGADVVAFSGDKLLGGPQAGILCGRVDLIEQLKRHPLARAIRADKLCLAALSATLTHYLREEAVEEIPVWQMIARPVENIAAVAEKWTNRLQERRIDAMILDGSSHVGGGSLPGTSLPTKLVALLTNDANTLTEKLRQATIPIISRIQDGRVLLDPRTVMPYQEEDLLLSLLEIYI